MACRYLPGCIKENQEKPQSEYPVSQPRFEESTSGIPAYSVTAISACAAEVEIISL
jgi:hypothetical protein